MSLNTECHSKWNVTQNEMLPKIKCYSNGMSPKMECHLKGNFSQNGISLKMECRSTLGCPKKTIWDFSQYFSAVSICKPTISTKKIIYSSSLQWDL